MRLREHKSICYECKKEIEYISAKRLIRSKRFCSNRCKQNRIDELERIKEEKGPITSRFQILDL